MLRRNLLWKCAVVAPSTTTTTVVTPSKMIFNGFSGRIIQNDSSIMHELKSSMGIAESPDRRGSLGVVDPAKLSSFVEEFHTDPDSCFNKMTCLASQSKNKKMKNSLVNLISNVQPGEDPVPLFEDFLKKTALDRLFKRDSMGSIGSVGSGDWGASSSTTTDDQQQQQQQLDFFQQVTLNPEQEKVCEYALQGYNLFISGDAGTGKTVTLKEMIRRLKGTGLRVAVTASTGLAAYHLGGTTFHSFSGIGKNNDFLQAARLMPSVDVIVIDEISMISGGLMHQFDMFLRGERNNSMPFGGTQIIVCGDFLQLEAIVDRESAKRDYTLKKPLYNLEIFRDHFLRCRLVKQNRQSDNVRFAEQLRELRVGKVPQDLFSETSGIRTVRNDDPVEDETIRLLPRNCEVREANNIRLDRLPGETLTFMPSTTSPTLEGDWSTSVVLEVNPGEFNIDAFNAAVHQYLLEQLTSDLHHYCPRQSLVSYHTHEDGAVIRLRMPTSPQRADVTAKMAAAWEKAVTRMHHILMTPNIRNLDKMAANGSSLDVPCGKVFDVLPNGTGLHTPQIEERLTSAMKDHPIAQPLPLKIGAPVLLRVNLSNSLVNGSVGTVVDYVPATPEKLPNFMTQSVHVRKALDQYINHNRFALGNEEPVIPLVRFRGSDKQDVPIPPWPFQVGGDVGSNFYSVDAVQMPLSLAFAFTVHKVQGLTLLAKVRLELDTLWDCDHLVYVAMSRVKSPKQLEISGWTDEKVRANNAAVEFDAGIEPVLNVQPRTESMCRAMWWRMKYSNYTEGVVSLAGSGPALSVLEDGTLRSGAGTGAHLNSSKLARTFRALSNNNNKQQQTEKSNHKQLPSLLPRILKSSNKQLRPTVTTVTETQTTKTTNTESIIPPKMFSKQQQKEQQLSFSAEPKSSLKKRSVSSSSSAKNNQQQQQQKSNVVVSFNKKNAK
jgi:ATP-dependent DNA helicase PIF1